MYDFPRLKLALRPAVLPLLVSAGLMGASTIASAQEPSAVEALHQTTLNLIKALVSSGVLPQAKADELIKGAQAASPSTMPSSQSAAPAQAGNSVRVPYVPQIVKEQLRQEVKDEVVAQAKAEGWGPPKAWPEWIDRIKIEGDVRLRGQLDQFGKDNTSPDSFVLHLGNFTRAPDLMAVNSAGNATANTQADRDRLRLRMRLAVMAKVSDLASVGLRLSTGSATDRVSTNQTLGQNFNKPQLLVDRAYIKLDPTPWLSFTGGRVPNPWFSTDLVWSENLNFEGAALSAKWPADRQGAVKPFATVGVFPIREHAPPRSSRWLYGAQLGMDWLASERTHVKLGVAQYVYKNIEGHIDNAYEANGGGPKAPYGQYAYDPDLRQKGNTLFATNSPLESADVTNVKWGLASKFKPVAITASADFAYFGPYSLMLAGEYVTNPAFDRQEIQQRTGLPLEDGSNKGYQLRAAFGSRDINTAQDWQVALAYRHLGSDAVLDAFTDSDFGLGGTNNKGYSLSVTKGLASNTSLGVRYLSTRSIDTPTANPDDKFSTSSFQVDLNARF